MANKRVHRPSESDLKKSDKYLLTHQDATGSRSGNRIKTTLLTGDIYETQTGGVQVQFTGKECLTSGGTSGDIHDR